MYFNRSIIWKECDLVWKINRNKIFDLKFRSRGNKGSTCSVHSYVNTVVLDTFSNRIFSHMRFGTKKFYCMYWTYFSCRITHRPLYYLYSVVSPIFERSTNFLLPLEKRNVKWNKFYSAYSTYFFTWNQLFSCASGLHDTFCINKNYI